MYIRKRKDRRTGLEKEIDTALMRMSDYDLYEKRPIDSVIDEAIESLAGQKPGTEGYDKILDHLEKLYRAKRDDRDLYSTMTENVERLYKAKSYEKTRGVSPDTIITVVGSLLGIILILGYEKAGVITSKALGFVLKGRV
jgi:hypothetical protein